MTKLWTEELWALALESRSEGSNDSAVSERLNRRGFDVSGRRLHDLFKDWLDKGLKPSSLRRNGETASTASVNVPRKVGEQRVSSLENVSSNMPEAVPSVLHEGDTEVQDDGFAWSEQQEGYPASETLSKLVSIYSSEYYEKAIAIKNESQRMQDLSMNHELEVNILNAYINEMNENLCTCLPQVAPTSQKIHAERRYHDDTALPCNRYNLHSSDEQSVNISSSVEPGTYEFMIEDMSFDSLDVPTERNIFELLAAMSQHSGDF